MPKGQSHKYSAEELEFLKRAAEKGMPHNDTAEAFNAEFGLCQTVGAIRGAMKRYGYYNGRDGRFKKGNIPGNKGKKIDWAWKSAITQFKPGNVPANRREIGEERLSKEGYVQVKIDDGHKNNNWKFKHWLIWERLHGPIPKGYMVIFIDGDRTNFEPENLMLISRAQNAILNRCKLRAYTRELMETALLVADLTLAAGNRSKRAREKK